MREPWEAFLEREFPGYLLPASAASALSEDVAARFLERLTGRPDQLALLRAVSTLSSRMAELEDLVHKELPALARCLPSRSHIQSREWEGGFHGRLDVRATLVHRQAGRVTRFVTRSRQRRFDLPENVLVRATALRLEHLLIRLRQAKVLSQAGWGARAAACEGALRHVLDATVLREIPLEAVTPFHERAAAEARGPCYALALDWHRALRRGLDTADPNEIARVVAAGALMPLEAPTRFELAVLLRLIQSVAAEVEAAAPGRWQLERSVVIESRREVARLVRDDGATIGFFYNQSVLDMGPVDRGVRHYLGGTGRLRPDITIVIRDSDRIMRAVVVEVKLSNDPDYVQRGYHEAHLYAREYGAVLTDWPKAILVSLAPTVCAPRRDDDVIAVCWDRWVPADVARALSDE
jgi:hypothetical protein